MGGVRGLTQANKKLGFYSANIQQQYHAPVNWTVIITKIILKSDPDVLSLNEKYLNNQKKTVVFLITSIINKKLRQFFIAEIGNWPTAGRPSGPTLGQLTDLRTNESTRSKLIHPGPDSWASTRAFRSRS